MMRPRLPVCSRCLARSKGFSTTATWFGESQNAPFPAQTAYARLTNRGLISITGIDSADFLQGLITQNMLVANGPSKSIRRTGTYTAFLNSQGRILNDAFIYPLPDLSGNDIEREWLVEVDKSEVPSLLKHLKKHKLRAKLKLRALEDGERTVWSSWKNHSEPRWAAYNLESESASPFSLSSNVVGCIDSRAPGFGSRIVTPGAEDLRTYLPDEAQIAGSEVELGAYTIRRILHGVAEGQSEIIRESALPMESNMDMARGIDFRKGCYVGQELTIRTHHTGVVRKRILPVQLYTGDLSSEDGPVYDPASEISLPPAGSNINKAGGRRGRSAGKFLNGVGNIGLALCRLEMMTDIVLTGEGTQFTPGTEFKVAWTAETEQPAEVKLQAFVPSWVREHIQSGGVRKPALQSVDTDGERARGFVEQLGEEAAQRRD
ncbi:transferase caf17 [Penicillium argentinense]|uniref:Iron-sulfur cluster assembly factor IBA57 homolog, mitochondrial n=1 Tax=Penicillium argentinense TaxID=1131581 RepID=A0A9W9FE16_9EURO|nr:transferase caf17 [Penicillium argentinense]KAJ5098513.1 transferase caf17 [Penicillium argentinense]